MMTTLTLNQDEVRRILESLLGRAGMSGDLAKEERANDQVVMAKGHETYRDNLMALYNKIEGEL